MRKRRILFWFVGAFVSLLGFVLVFPGKLIAFAENSIAVRESYVSLWLVPQRWEGLYTANAEGYVNGPDMQLSNDLNVSLSLYYVTAA